MKLKLINKKSIVILTGLFLAGCGNKIPECGDTSATELLKSILFEKVMGSDSGVKFKSSQIIVENVETISKDAKLNKNQCQAIIKWTLTPDAARLVDVIRKPEKENALALSIGAFMSDPLLREPDRTEIARKIYTKAKNDPKEDRTTGMTIGVIRGNISKILEDSPAQLNDNVVSINSNKIKYSVRLSEDSKSKNEFIVETQFDAKSIEAIMAIESLVIIEKEGKKVITQFTTPR